MPNISFYCQEEFEVSSYKWLHTKTQPIGHRMRLRQSFSVNVTCHLQIKGGLRSCAYIR
jgi:hypothetical protein